MTQLNIKQKYNNDFNNKFKFYFCLLNPLGLWPSENNLNSITYKNKLKMTLSIWLMLFALIPHFLKIFIEVEEPKDKLYMYGSASYFVAILIQYVLLLGRLTTVYRCIDDIRTIWNRTVNEKERQSMMKLYKNGLLHSVRCAVLLYSSAIAFIIFFPFSSKSVGSNSLSRNFPFTTYNRLLNPQDLTTFVIVYVLQLFAGYIFFTVSCAFCGFAAMALTNVSAQLDIVMIRIDNIVLHFSKSHSMNEQEFSKIFRQHSYIIRQYCDNQQNNLMNKISNV